MSWMVDGVGRLLARYLEKPVQGYEPFTPSDPDALRGTLQPGDVLLVEGNNHISGVIKYLTQSTWSHAALYVGPIGDRETPDGEPLVLVEANIGQGVVAAPLSKYARFHTRICRPTRLDEDDRARVCAYAAERIGFDYDLKNIIDLMRYLFPLPVPQHLLGADRTGLRDGTLSNSAESNAAREQGRAPGDSRDSPLVTLCSARFRYFPLFRGGQANHCARLQLQGDCLGRRASCRRCGHRPGPRARRQAFPGRLDCCLAQCPNPA